MRSSIRICTRYSARFERSPRPAIRTIHRLNTDIYRRCCFAGSTRSRSRSDCAASSFRPRARCAYSQSYQSAHAHVCGRHVRSECCSWAAADSRNRHDWHRRAQFCRRAGWRRRRVGRTRAVCEAQRTVVLSCATLPRISILLRRSRAVCSRVSPPHCGAAKRLPASIALENLLVLELHIEIQNLRVFFNDNSAPTFIVPAAFASSQS